MVLVAGYRLPTHWHFSLEICQEPRISAFDRSVEVFWPSICNNGNCCGSKKIDVNATAVLR